MTDAKHTPQAMTAAKRIWDFPREFDFHEFVRVGAQVITQETAKTAQMTDEQFVAFLGLWMCSDPWPKSLSAKEHATLLDFANSEAKRRGYDGWVHAYHEIDRLQPGRLGNPLRAKAESANPNPQVTTSTVPATESHAQHTQAPRDRSDGGESLRRP